MEAAANLSEHMQKFIKTIILCKNCGLPELWMRIAGQEKSRRVEVKCDSCGATVKLDIKMIKDKFKNYILNNPPPAHKSIDDNAERKKHGQKARIRAKLNSLVDPQVIEALYRASQAGVKIDLIVRGACMIRPGEPGLSQTVHVRSVVGRFLEHSRIFYFANGGEEEVYIGSADWMSRNLDRRVEVVAPVVDPQAKTYLKDTVLAAYLRDNVKARVMNSDGSYVPPPMEAGEEPFNSQLFFEGPNSSPPVGNVHALKRKKLWTKPQESKKGWSES